MLKFSRAKARTEQFARTLLELRGCPILEAAGHWIQRERADAVNELLLGFLKSLWPRASTPRLRGSTGATMSIQDFTVTHAKGAFFERGLRSFFEYRDLGIRQATEGQVVAHVIRAAAGAEFSGQPHLHKTGFQLVYVLKGWIEFEYEGQGVVRLEAGSCVYQPPEIRHRELGHSEDVEMLEVVMPADFKTEEVADVTRR